MTWMCVQIKYIMCMLLIAVFHSSLYTSYKCVTAAIILTHKLIYSYKCSISVYDYLIVSYSHLLNFHILTDVKLKGLKSNIAKLSWMSTWLILHFQLHLFIIWVVTQVWPPVRIFWHLTVFPNSDNATSQSILSISNWLQNFSGFSVLMTWICKYNYRCKKTQPEIARRSCHLLLFSSACPPTELHRPTV